MKEKEKLENDKKRVKKEDLVYETDKYVYNFQHYETIRSFAKYIFDHKIALENTNKDQNDLFNGFIDFKKGTSLKDIDKKT